MQVDKVAVVGVMDSLCESCQEYLNNLPLYEPDTRLASLIAWCLAYTCDDYDKLPLYWHKAVGTLILELRLERVRSDHPTSFPEAVSFGQNFLQHLWKTKGRKYCACNSQNGWAFNNIPYSTYYEALQDYLSSELNDRVLK